MAIQARGINKILLGPYHGDAYPRKCKVTKKGDIPLHIALYSMPNPTPY